VAGCSRRPHISPQTFRPLLIPGDSSTSRLAEASTRSRPRRRS
jgi:hypothetical protein